jgi:hypothetical protein
MNDIARAEAQALTEFEAGDAQDELEAEAAEREAGERAEATLCRAEGVRDLLDTPGVDGETHIARAMRNLDRACQGNQIALDAVLTALTCLQAEMRAVAIRNELGKVV